MCSSGITRYTTGCVVTAAGVPHLQASSLLHQECIVLLPLECLDLVCVVHLNHTLLHDVTEQHLAVQRLGSVRVIIQHLVCRLYLFPPKLCSLFSILLINLQSLTTDAAVQM